MKTGVIFLVVIAVIGPVFLFRNVIYSGGLMMHDNRCISANTNAAQPVAIEKSLLEFGESESLSIKNLTEIRRDLESNSELVHVEFLSRKIFPTFRIRVVVNSHYSDSAVIYGRKNLSQQGKVKFESLQQMLKAEYGFGFKALNKDGICD